LILAYKVKSKRRAHALLFDFSIKGKNLLLKIKKQMFTKQLYDDIIYYDKDKKSKYKFLSKYLK